jgi:pilus assembly protein CpaB
MNRRVIAVLVAVVLAVLGGALVINYVRSADARALAAQQPVKVYVAEKLIPAGTTLKDAERTQLFVETRVAASALPVGALQDVNPDNNALLALSDIQPGEFLMSARFGSTPVGEKAIEVPSGMLAMSVELSDPARVGKFVTPGSHIAIYATHKIKLFGTDPKVKAFNDLDVKGTTVLLPDVQVIGMGDTPLAAPQQAAQEEGDKQAATPGFLVTLAVAPDDAPRLAHAINDYTLYAGLRGPDVKVDAKSGTDDTTVFSNDLTEMLKKVQ